jgi:ribosomal protein S18 acetylase RimI-like enzyme
MPESAVGIGRAERTELEALARLRDGHTLFRRYGPEAASAGSLRRALDAGDGILVARRAGAPIGMAWWSPRGAFARSPYLRLLVVAVGEAGSGVGSLLMDAVEREAFSGADDLLLLVTRDNVGAIRFYGRRGFEHVGLLHDYVVPGVDEVVMRKRRPHGGVRRPPA